MAGMDRMTIAEVVREVLRDEHADVIRESVRAVAQELMEAEISELIGAERGERTEDRATHRNGYRPRRWDTRAGEIELQIPKIRQGSYFPIFLQPRKRSEQALVSVVQQAYVCGVSTRRVDQLVESLGLRISKSEVSRIAGLLDEQVQAFRERPLEGRYPYVFVDAKIEKVRAGGRVARKCVVVAHAVHETGPREIIGLDVGEAETEAFWTEFLRSLVARGLVGVQLAISDAHPGLEGRDRQGPRLAVAALHRALPARPQGPLPQRPARRARRPDPPALHRRRWRRGAPAPGRRDQPARAAAAEDRTAARGGRRRRPGVLRVPGRALAQAALDQPAGALQPRDRPPHRRRRHLPRRPLRDPPRLDARHRSQRRMARRAQLHQPWLDGHSLRDTDRYISLFQIRTGGRRARRSVSTNVFTDEMSAGSLTPRPGT